jgi:hypothetical protein
MVGDGNRYKKMKAPQIRFETGIAISSLERCCSAILILMMLCLARPGVSQTQAREFVFKKDMTFSDLPEGITKRVIPGSTPSEVDAMLSGQPSIVIDGSTLTITPPPVGSSRSIAVKSIEFRNGGRIVTNGVNLEIAAQVIVSERGAIVSFDDQGRRRGTAALGDSGKSGFNAGTVVLTGSLNGSNILIVSLFGQDGESGGSGAVGPGGAQGPRGEDGVDRLFDCAHGGGNGGPGSPGGKGGSGGNGGAGGDGGRLILRGGLAAQRAQIEFSALGGKGGNGGSPGPGGPGGPGGQGGSGSAHCGGGRAGQNGQPGPPGEPGRVGPDGKNGLISAD